MQLILFRPHEPPLSVTYHHHHHHHQHHIFLKMLGLFFPANYLFYFTNGRYIECLSLICATDKRKTQKKEKKEELHKKQKEQKKSKHSG